MKLLRLITLPFVPIYYVVTKLRNFLYDHKFLKSTAYNLPIICVGNLSVGGTGKTPMIEYLINLLKSDYQLATLSRGYGRKTKGFILATEGCNTETLGDEPYQFFNKFNPDVLVAVDENRVHGVKQLLSLDKSPKVILLDDAFQHRKIKAGFKIMLTAFGNLFTDDFVLPTGNLREPKSGSNRADVIIITKCPPNLNDDQKVDILQKIRPKANQKVFFSQIKYGKKALSSSEEIAIEALGNFTLVTGIANPKPLVDYLESLSLNFEHLNFKDHHNFSDRDIDLLKHKNRILTTEKDFMRLKTYNILAENLYYLPIKTAIDKNEQFNRLIIDFVESY